MPKKKKNLVLVETLKLRQQKAVELRDDVDRSSRMSEADVAELRLHIKVRLHPPP